jgi:hypothetical protein
VLALDLTLVNVEIAFCAKRGTVVLTRDGASRLQALWQDGDSPMNTATGSLTRQ